MFSFCYGTVFDWPSGQPLFLDVQILELHMLYVKLGISLSSDHQLYLLLGKKRKKHIADHEHKNVTLTSHPRSVLHLPSNEQSA